MHTRPRYAFSLIELVVVMAILGVLTALLLPAIHKIREAAALAQCASNLRQLGIAAYTYNDLHHRLPDGCTMAYAQPAFPPLFFTDASGIPPNEIIDLGVTDSPARINSDPNYPFGPNWAVHLLPHVEQNNLHAQARVGDYLIGHKAGNPSQRDYWRGIVKDKSIPAYLCPSDPANMSPFAGYPPPLIGTGTAMGAPGPWARGNYAANAGPGWWPVSFNGATYRESYGQTGPVMSINFGAVLPLIADGLSNTVMFTEVRAGADRDDPRGVWAIGLPGSSITAANAIGDCTNPNDANEKSDDLEGCPKFWYPGIGAKDRMGCNTGLFGLGWASWQAQSRSRHAGGVNVCLCDGSVRTVGNYVQQGVWFFLLSAHDGQPIGSYD